MFKKELVVIRKYQDNFKTLSHIYLNNKFFCYCLELPDRGNKKEKSRIPMGKYKTKEHNSLKYKYACLIQDVKDRSYILIHEGNKIKDTNGCLLFAKKLNSEAITETNADINYILQSKIILSKLFDKIGKKFEITILEDFTDDIEKLENPDLKLSKNINLIIKNMSPLILVAPFLKKAGGTLIKKITEKGAKKFLEKIEEKTGVNVIDNDSQETALDLISSSDIKEIAESYNRTLATEIKHGEDLGKTWKDEFATLSVVGLLYVIVIISIINIDTAKQVILSLKSILELKYYGIAFVSVVLSAVGLRTALIKFIDKKFK